MLTFSQFIAEGAKYTGDDHEKILHKHGWEVSDTDGSGNEASYYHQNHGDHFIHVHHGKWEHHDEDGPTGARGKSSESLAKHLERFHKK